MIRIFFDHQYKLNKNLWEFRFYNLLINELNVTGEFYCFSSENEDESLSIIKQNNFDIFINTGYNKYFLSKLNGEKKLCTFVNNVNYELFGSYAYTKIEDINRYIQNKIEIIFLTNCLISGSELSIDVMKTIYKAYDEFFDITSKINYLPLFVKKNELKEYKEKPLINKQYILLTDNRGEMIDFKLYNQLLDTIKDWIIENDIYIVITGNERNYIDIKFLNSIGLYNKVIYFDINNNNDILNNLYRYALCQICPNIVDGFPYYMLEGYNNDCITLLNEDNVSFKEISKENGLYFTFDNVIEKLDIIKNINISDYNLIIEQQHKILEDYTCDKILYKYIDLFKKIIINERT